MDDPTAGKGASPPALSMRKHLHYFGIQGGQSFVQLVAFGNLRLSARFVRLVFVSKLIVL